MTEETPASQPENESLEELQKRKLKAEIKDLNKSQWKTPAFWGPVVTLLLAVGAYSWLARTGFFNYLQAHNQYVADTLAARSKILDSTIKVQHDSLTAARNEVYSEKRKLKITGDSLTAYRNFLDEKKNSLTKKDLSSVNFKIRLDNLQRDSIMLNQAKSKIESMFRAIRLIRFNYGKHPGCEDFERQFLPVSEEYYELRRILRMPEAP